MKKGPLPYPKLVIERFFLTEMSRLGPKEEQEPAHKKHRRGSTADYDSLWPAGPSGDGLGPYLNSSTYGRWVSDERLVFVQKWE